MTGRGAGAVCRGRDPAGRRNTPVPCDAVLLSPLENVVKKVTTIIGGNAPKKEDIYGQQQTQLPVWPRWSGRRRGRGSPGGTGSIAQAAAPAKRFEQVNGEFWLEAPQAGSQECAKVAYEGYWYKGYACGLRRLLQHHRSAGRKIRRPYNQFPLQACWEANKGHLRPAPSAAPCTVLLRLCPVLGPQRNAPHGQRAVPLAEVTKLPIYNPGDLAQGVKGDLPNNASGSVLCPSPCQMGAANKIEATSKARSERCGRLTADVAYKDVWRSSTPRSNRARTTKGHLRRAARRERLWRMPSDQRATMPTGPRASWTAPPATTARNPC